MTNRCMRKHWQMSLMDGFRLVQQLKMNDCLSRNLAQICTNELLSMGTIFVFDASESTLPISHCLQSSKEID